MSFSAEREAIMVDAFRNGQKNHIFLGGGHGATLDT